MPLRNRLLYNSLHQISSLVSTDERRSWVSTYVGSITLAGLISIWCAWHVNFYSWHCDGRWMPVFSSLAACSGVQGMIWTVASHTTLCREDGGGLACMVSTITTKPRTRTPLPRALMAAALPIRALVLSLQSALQALCRWSLCNFQSRACKEVQDF